MDISFEKIKKLFGSLRSMAGSGAVVGIDIGSSSIKIVQLSRKGGRIILDTYGALSLGPYANLEIGRATVLPAPKIVEVLTDLFREASVTSKQCGVSIPLSSSLVTTIEMPQIAEKDLVQMVPIEARKYIPVAITEVALDWWVIPKPETTEASAGGPGSSAGKLIEVLLVAILNEALQRYQDIVTQAQLTSSFFEVEIFSTIRSVVGEGTQPVMVVDFGAASTKIYIIEWGIVRVSHTISKGAQDITLVLASAFGISVAEAENFKRTQGLAGVYEGKTVRETTENVLRYVFTEANLVLTNFEKHYGRSVERVYLTGGGSTLSGILEVAKTVFETDVALGDPFTKVQTPAFMEPVLKQVGPEFAVALGVALRKLSEQEGE